eukprot:5784335-Pleurochrysis_carterae.AAC.3
MDMRIIADVCARLSAGAGVVLRVGVRWAGGAVQRKAGLRVVVCLDIGKLRCFGSLIHVVGSRGIATVLGIHHVRRDGAHSVGRVAALSGLRVSRGSRRVCPHESSAAAVAWRVRRVH